MEIEITSEAKKDLEYWKKSGNAKILKRIRELLESIQETSIKGIDISRKYVSIYDNKEMILVPYIELENLSLDEDSIEIFIN